MNIETVYFCPKCENKIQKLQACGATQFFCDHCNELVSKSKVLTEKPTVAAE